MNALDNGPVDLAAVQTDEALLSVLPFAVRGGDRTTQGLMTLRRVVHSKPFPSLVDVDTARAVIRAGRRSRRHRYPVPDTLACAIAVLMLVLSVVGLVSLGAEPGDLLGPLRELLYGGGAR